jgi:tetratricopeptide (TPR) repeat protein
MEKQMNGVRKALGWSLAAAMFLAASQNVLAQQAEGEKAPAPTIDAATGKVLNEAIELLNMENFAGAGAKIATLNLEKLSPYERSKVEQILFNIAYSQDKYDEARGHLQKAIEAGGLNAQEVEQARYQAAQLYMTQEKWKEGAAALEEWFKTATNPNSAAYYLLAVAYYQQDDFARAIGASRCVRSSACGSRSSKAPSPSIAYRTCRRCCAASR